MTAAVAQVGRPAGSGRQPARVEARRDAIEELTARAQEAGLFTSAIRTVVTRLEALLLQPSVEVSPEAIQLTLQLRAMSDRYARRWEPEA